MDLPIGAPDSYIQGRSISDAKREHFLTILRKKGLVAPLRPCMRRLVKNSTKKTNHEGASVNRRL